MLDEHDRTEAIAFVAQVAAAEVDAAWVATEAKLDHATIEQLLSRAVSAVNAVQLLTGRMLAPAPDLTAAVVDGLARQRREASEELGLTEADE